MTEPSSKTKWPNYLPLPREDIFALGVISLNYCQLEKLFGSLLAAIACWNEYERAALFQRLPNNHRLEVTAELLAKTTIPDEAKKQVKHFLSGYEICAENRNLIMHSSAGGMHRSPDSAGLILERHSKPGNTLVCYLTLERLQEVADAIHSFTTFGAWVLTDVTNYATHLRARHPEDYRPSPATLRETPPLPTKLNWHTPEGPKASGIPPAALHLISAYRIRDRDKG